MKPALTIRDRKSGKVQTKIARACNGVILEVPGEMPEVFEFDDQRRRRLMHLLCAVLEILGASGSKWDRERVEVRIVHGRGYECKDKSCEICGE
jgi:hypothetical protein